MDNPNGPMTTPDAAAAEMDPRRRQMLVEMLMQRARQGQPNTSPMGAAMQGLGNGLQMALMSGALGKGG